MCVSPVAIKLGPFSGLNLIYPEGHFMTFLSIIPKNLFALYVRRPEDDNKKNLEGQKIPGVD